MIVRIDAELGVMLVEADDFRSFKIVVEGDVAASRLDERLRPAIRFESPEQAWVEADAVRRWSGRAGDPGWTAAFDDMIAFARDRGWVREEPLCIAAHVERARGRARRNAHSSPGA